jgi:small subunit ribosomal protein S4
VNIPSYSVGRGQVVTLSEKAANMIVIQHNIDTLDHKMVAWIDRAEGGKQVTVRELPSREQIDVPVREQLIVELYSK